ncbi:MAG: hypothetical protein WAT91_15670, partial [Saprospiraceae bacterium]
PGPFSLFTVCVYRNNISGREGSHDISMKIKAPLSHMNFVSKRYNCKKRGDGGELPENHFTPLSNEFCIQ